MREVAATRKRAKFGRIDAAYLDLAMAVWAHEDFDWLSPLDKAPGHPDGNDVG